MDTVGRPLVLPLALPLVLLLFTSHQTDATEQREPRFFSHQDILADFKEGLEAAGRFVGVDTSQGVASLVSASFTPSSASDKQDANQQQPSSLFHGFFRLLGFDNSKLNAIAVNAVVFIAKMIGSSLIKNFTGATGRHMEGEHVPEGSPLSWILEDVTSQARSLLSRAQDGDLPSQLISSLQAVPTDTDCIQLLVCRAAPLLTGMQNSLRDLLSPTDQLHEWAALSPLQRMYHYLPSRQQLLGAASSCGQRIPSCSQLFAAFDD